jgi:hypothetical protein
MAALGCGQPGSMWGSAVVVLIVGRTFLSDAFHFVLASPSCGNAQAGTARRSKN